MHFHSSLLMPYNNPQAETMILQRASQMLTAAFVLVVLGSRAGDPEDSNVPNQHTQDLRTQDFLSVSDRLEAAPRNVRPRLHDPEEARTLGQFLRLAIPPSLSQNPHHETAASPQSTEHHGAISDASLSVLREASRSPEPNRIPAVVDANGQLWGPFDLHPSKFQPVEYLLTMSQLSHLYTFDGTRPAGFVQAKKARRIGFKVRPLAFRPDPELLQEIQRSTIGFLERQGILPQQLIFAPGTLHEGKFLLPPLEQAPLGLQMPKAFLERLVFLPGERLRERLKASSNLYHMIVRTSEGPRNVLMTSANTYAWTTLPQKSPALWLFYEGRQSIRTRKHSLAFLGSMYLPQSAQDMLLEGQVISHYVPETIR